MPAEAGRWELEWETAGGAAICKTFLGMMLCGGVIGFISKS